MKKTAIFLILSILSWGLVSWQTATAQTSATTVSIVYEGESYELSQSFTAPMKITYNGDSSLKTYEVVVRLGSMRSTYSGFFLTDLQPNQSMSVNVPVEFWSQLESGNHEFSCWVSKINGGDAYTASTDTLRFKVSKFGENELSVRKILYEGFSSANCMYCPAFNEKVNPVLEELGDRVVAVKYHVSFSSDPYYTSYGNSVFRSYYATGGIPKGAVDGFGYHQDQVVGALRNSVASAGKSFLSLTKDTVYINDDLLHLSINVNSLVKEDNLSIKAYVLEKTMNQQHGSNKEREFYHLFIQNFTFSKAEGLSVSPDQTLKMEAELDMSKTFMEESFDLEVVMIVYDADKKILQTEKFDVYSTQEPYILLDSLNFPDSAFRAYVSENVDKDSDGKLQESEWASLTDMNVSDKGIYTLEGISLFKNLKSLDCSSNHLMFLDLSANTAITELKCSGQNRTVDLEEGNIFDLSTVEGLDASKIGNVKNATLDSVIMKFNANEVSYEYACGLGESVMEVMLSASRFTSNQKVDAPAGFSVYVDGREICVVFEDAAQEAVEVYDLRGVQVYRGMQDRISVMNPGIYLVRVGSVVKKLAVL